MEKVSENGYASTDIRGCNPGYVVTSAGRVAIDTPQLPTRAVAAKIGATEAMKYPSARILGPYNPTQKKS